jgi:hypothetical protein
MNTKRTGWCTPTDLDTLGGTSSGAPKPVKADLLVAKTLKNSSQFSNNTLKKENNDIKKGRAKQENKKEEELVVEKEKKGRRKRKLADFIFNHTQEHLYW